MVSVKEHGNLSLDQQAKLMGEIKFVSVMEDDELAEANADEIKSFIDMLHAFGFIGSDKKSRYLLGLEDALERRRKKNA